eukprot:Skav222989  [mRNA]  locus=scaffold1827:208962:209531:- [translate_table: standard]
MRLFCIWVAYLHVLSLAGSEMGDETTQARTLSSSSHLYVQNSCHKKVRIAIAEQNGLFAKPLLERCWWEFSPGSAAYLSAKGERLTRAGTYWYVYAEGVNDTTDENVRRDDTTIFEGKKPDDWEAIGGDYKWEGNEHGHWPNLQKTDCGRGGKKLGYRKWSHMVDGDFFLRFTCPKINDLIAEPNVLVP